MCPCMDHYGVRVWITVGVRVALTMVTPLLGSEMAMRGANPDRGWLPVEIGKVRPWYE